MHVVSRQTESALFHGLHCLWHFQWHTCTILLARPEIGAPTREKTKAMKYLTAELLAECRSSNDDAAELASDQWEQAITAYNARLAGIRADYQEAAGCRPRA